MLCPFVHLGEVCTQDFSGPERARAPQNTRRTRPGIRAGRPLAWLALWRQGESPPAGYLGSGLGDWFCSWALLLSLLSYGMAYRKAFAKV